MSETKPPIRVEIIPSKDGTQQFLASFARPGRIEVVLVNGNMHACIYEGAEIDQEQEPLGAVDFTLPEGVHTGWTDTGEWHSSRETEQ